MNVFTTKNCIKKMKRAAIEEARSLYLRACEMAGQLPNPIETDDLDILGVMLFKGLKEVNPLLVLKLADQVQLALLADKVDSTEIWSDFLKSAEVVIQYHQKCVESETLIANIFAYLEEMGVVKMSEFATPSDREKLKTATVQAMKLRSEICLGAIELAQADALEDGDNPETFGLQGTPEQVLYRLAGKAANDRGQFLLDPSEVLESLEIVTSIVKGCKDCVLYAKPLDILN